MSDALRLSRQQRLYADVLWQDMLATYGDKDSPDYWRQRVKRRAYQGAIVHHLLTASQSLAEAILKQLADTRFVDAKQLAVADLKPLLEQQSFLSGPAKLLLSACEAGFVMQLQQAQAGFDAGVQSASPAELGESIGLVAEDNLKDPDQWPVGQWLRDVQQLQEAVQGEMLEF